MTPLTIKLIRFDGGLWVSHNPPYLLAYLRYSHRSFATVHYKRVNKYEVRELYRLDGKGGLFTLQGFFTKIVSLIKAKGDEVEVIDRRTPLPTPDINYLADRLHLRDYQIDPVSKFIEVSQRDSGIVNAAGGFGKTHVMAATYAAYHTLNTIVATPLKQVTVQTYKKFKALFPDKHVGLVGDGHYDISNDITITTFKSLGACAVEKCKLLLIDELQQASGDKFQAVLHSVKPARIFGYTATDEGLFNKADKLLKGLFGDRLIYIPYTEAQAQDAVVPGKVYFIRMPDQGLAAAYGNSMDTKIKRGIKQNAARNELLGRACGAVPNGWQTLIFVEHILDHLVSLYKVMPQGTKFVHRESSKKRAGAFALTKKQQDQTIDAFLRNEVQHLIVTDAFKAGVDVQNCRVIVQASGGSSEVEILQEALRASRILEEETRDRLGVTPKTHFVLIDVWDSHDEALEGMSAKRLSYYKKQGWDIRIVDRIEDIDWNLTNEKDTTTAGTEIGGGVAAAETSGNTKT